MLMDMIILGLAGGGRDWWASDLGRGGGGCGYVWATWFAVAFILLSYATRRGLNYSAPWKRHSERQISAERSEQSSVVRGKALPTPVALEGKILQNAQRISEHFSDIHLQMLLNELEERFDREEHWETVIEKKNDNVSYSAKCCDPKDGGPTKYISTTTFENCTTELLRDFYMDNEFRKEWDKTVLEHNQLEIDRENGIEIGRTIKKFPFLTPREYVLAWRVWEGKENGFYCLIKACGHPLAAKQSKNKRVEFYISGWRIRKVQGRDACEIKMVHQEDAGLKREIAKMVFSKGIWSYVCKMEANLRKYAQRPRLQYDKQPSAVTLMQKVPSGVQETQGDVEGPIEDSIVELISGSKEEIQKNEKLTAHQSKKKLLAKGLLLLGGAIFITKGYSSLGAKLAVACVINKLVKKHGVSKNIFQKQLLLRPPVEDRISEHFSEIHLQMLLNELEERFDREEHWETVIEKKNDNVSYSAKCCDPKDGGPTKYISTTTFENCTTELLRDFYMDNEFRKEWDKTVLEHNQLEIDRENGIEIGRTIKKFPFLTPREYVLAWRVWEGKEKGFYCLIKDCGHPLAAKQSKNKRVEFYFSRWRIRKSTR